MAQRYGRKRKRAHLAKIAALSDAHAREASLLAHNRNVLADLRSEVEAWDAEIRRLLGANTAFQRETPIVVSKHPIREVPVMVHVPLYSSYLGDIPYESMTALRQRMRRFILEISRDRERYRRHIRFIESDGGQGTAYSISEEMLACGMGQRERDYLARQIAKGLIEGFNEESPWTKRAKAAT